MFLEVYYSYSPNIWKNYFDLVWEESHASEKFAPRRMETYMSIWVPTLACANANFWHYGHETWLCHAWFRQVRKHNSACCRQGHADLTRTVSGASDAAGRHKQIEPIDRGFPPARESKEQCEKLQVALLCVCPISLSLFLLLLIMNSKSRRKTWQADATCVTAGGRGLSAPPKFQAIHRVTRDNDVTHNVKITGPPRMKTQNCNNILETRCFRARLPDTFIEFSH